MNDHLATAMGRALDLTRAGSALEATRLIQETLNGTASAASPKSQSTLAKPRRPLGRIVDALAATRRPRPLKSRGSSKMPTVPEGARFVARTHASSHGERGYRLFVPSTREVEPIGIVLMLHGCTQDANDFATGTRMNLVAEENNLIVVYADQTRQANQMGCWNWFRPEDQGRDAGEPALLADLAQRVADEFAIGDSRTFVAGLSAGGAMAAILGHTHPDVFSAVGVHSGLAAGAASDVTSAFAAMRGHGASAGNGGAAPVRTIVFHGAADTTVAPANADAVIARALGTSRHAEVEDRSTMGATVTLYTDMAGARLAEKWSLGGVAHAWSGGSAEGSYTDPTGPDASTEMVRFFLAHGSGARP